MGSIKYRLKKLESQLSINCEDEEFFNSVTSCDDLSPEELNRYMVIASRKFGLVNLIAASMEPDEHDETR